MVHLFITNVAEEVGIPAAIIAYNLDFWIAKNKANKKHFINGRYWTYNSISALSELFPYLTENQIRYAIDKLISSGYLITGDFSTDRFNRTTWYSLENKYYELIKEDLTNRVENIPNTISENSEMDSGNFTKHTDITTDNKHNTSLVESDAELFDDDENANIKDTHMPKCNKVVTKKKNIDKSQFRLYDEVCSYFDEKVRSDKWLSVYDKLIRIDGYTEERILEIVKEFRRVGNWWRDSNNFISLAKLRKENDENVLYIHVFDSKMPKKTPEPTFNAPTQQPQSTEITDF